VQVKRLLQELLRPVMHKKRSDTMIGLISTLLATKKLSASGLGRSFATLMTITQRSGLRIVDRFLGNKKLYNDLSAIYTAFICTVIGNRKSIDIIVDWTKIPNSGFYALRAAIVAQGRAITIMEDVYPGRKLGNKKVHNRFLERLKKSIPPGVKICIITDGGFHINWFRTIISFGWDYLGRVRIGSGKKYRIEEKGEWKTLIELSQQATKTPQYAGQVWLTKENTLQTHFYIYKSLKKNRKSLNKSGKRKKNIVSLDCAKAAREPWLLVASIEPSKKDAHKTASIIIEKYKTRMQIEEGIRDLKSTRYGFGLEQSLSKKIERLKILLLMAMLASYYAWLLGYIGGKDALHYDYQSNSKKNKKSLSNFSLGCELIRDKIKIPITRIRAAMQEQWSPIYEG
jgi:hypothetical protein